MGHFQFTFVIFSAIYILVAWAIYLMFRINQPYFGAQFSMCIGGYFAAYTSVVLNWPFWLILIAAMIFCAIISLILAFKLADLEAFPMFIASLALVLIVQTTTRNLGFLGGQYGLFGVADVSQGVLLGVTYGLLLIFGYCVYRIDHSYIGRAMDAVFFDRRTAASLGINVRKLSIQLQVLSSAIGGAAGVIYTFVIGGAFPQAFGMTLFLYSLTIIVCGGMYTMWGIIITAPVLWGVSQVLPKEMTGFTNIAYAVLLIVMLLVRPSGIIDRKLVKAITNGSKAFLQKFSRRQDRTIIKGG